MLSRPVVKIAMDGRDTHNIAYRLTLLYIYIIALIAYKLKLYKCQQKIYHNTYTDIYTITSQLSRVLLYASQHHFIFERRTSKSDPKTTLLSFPPFSNQASYECYSIPRISSQSRRFGNAIKQNSD